jgi:hypothetical protein
MEMELSHCPEKVNRNGLPFVMKVKAMILQPTHLLQLQMNLGDRNSIDIFGAKMSCQKI